MASFPNFPKDYTYAWSDTTSDEIITVKVKEISDEITAKEWIQKWSEATLMTWRVMRTYPNSGKINVYKVDLRCQHNTDKRTQGIRSTKNTNCPVTLSIVVRSFWK
ncbi:uncharacterized protein LOC126892406 [Diabrotica virgifera virgifera]|uniref:Uncharacterized protein n=1 Tax=Diabrotica virgifera virgifera TaxID=50390 RepID=A0ABM5L623_DIAVI|nr:uncharacterized protein LOC126892406 [Diabrotica virgifera virgifera]